ncbi:epoxide hydrolase family protein [Rugamonas sp.]|uniref:epoxide hydrolase family protein n=1 Tax=Rugamonas sp. TaxID=1926287 RepID=UPI0025D58D10|nr:epoxide hydrolase family protein [Rugamonas sp.]
MKITPWQPPSDQPAIADLQGRLAATRWSDEVAADWTYGTAQQPLRELVAHWQSGYDWAGADARLRALPHFRAEIDGFGIHFLHFKGRGPSPRALLLMNGWPSSFVEYGKLAAMLADPAGHGGTEDDAFDVVIPALPGFGYSDRPTRPNQVDAVDLFHRLMTEGLGYPTFIASGTDIGAGVATRMALKYPASLLAIHISALTDPPLTAASAPLNDAERAYQQRVQKWRDDDGAYQHLQSTRPQTPAYALNDSPVGLASWILEKFKLWSDAGPNLFDAFPMDMLIDNLNLYWSTQTIASSMRYYYEARHFRAPLQPGQRVTVPTAITMWPHDLVVGPRDWAERFYNVRQYSVQPHGGHFPAWERPDLYAQELRKLAASL